MSDTERAREIAGPCESAPLGRECDGWQSECRACGIARRVGQALAAARAEEREAAAKIAESWAHPPSHSIAAAIRAGGGTSTATPG